MKKCIKAGAIKLRIIVAASFAVATISTASATEFGNFFGPPAKQSSEASAVALEGLATLFHALRGLELQEPAARGDVVRAGEMLIEASKMMTVIQLPADQTLSLEKQSGRDYALIAQVAEYSKLPPPTTVSEVYKVFINETEAVGTLILAQRDQTGPVLPVIYERLTMYIALGGAVSRTLSP